MRDANGHRPWDATQGPLRAASRGRPRVAIRVIMRGSHLGRRWDAIGRRAALVVAAMGLLACGVSVGPNGNNIGCAQTNCPPPARSAATAHTFRASHFSFQYFDPWQINSHDANSAVVVAQTNYGDLAVELASTSVSAGTSAQALLTQTVNNLDTSQFSGLQDQGPIYGANIGYVAGAGESFAATSDQPNAPSVPVYLQFMASVKGTVGVIFISSSTLDPSGPDPTDPRQVPNGAYDRIVASVAWT